MTRKKINHTIVCKYCGLSTVSRCGSYNGVQRYYCKSCQRKFKDDTSAFHARVPSEIINTALSLFYNGSRTCDIIRILKQEYNFNPSRGLVYQWISKYSNTASVLIKDYQPEASDLWVISRTFFRYGTKLFKMIDIVDAATHFLLATSMMEKHDIFFPRNLLKEAAMKSGKYPKLIMGHMHYSYFQLIKKTFDCEAEHMHNKLSAKEYNTELVGIVNRIFRPRVKILRNLKSMARMKEVVDGWYVYYNFMVSQSQLDYQTPAEAAGIVCSMKSWQDIASQIPVIRNGSEREFVPVG